MIRWNIILAELNFLSGAERLAQRALREALESGAGSRTLRSFLDEGALMQTMLSSAHGNAPASPQPADAFAASCSRCSQDRSIPTVEPVRPAPVVEALQGHLSAKEQEILGLVGSGLSKREIAQRIGMTEGTVKWYLQQVYDKIGIRRRQHAVRRARQIGLIPS